MSGCGGGTGRPLGPAIPRFNDPGPTSLAEDLGSVVNDAREIEAELGLLPHRVFAVRVRWSGGEIGLGDPVRVIEQEFLPRPRVTQRTIRDLKTGGYVERGSITVTGINPLYTEDQINDLFGVALERGEDAWIEIYVDSRDGPTERRRYVIDAPPERRADQMDWTVSMRRQDRGRARDGSVRYPGQR